MKLVMILMIIILIIIIMIFVIDRQIVQYAVAFVVHKHHVKIGPTYILVDLEVYDLLLQRI